MPYSVDLRKRVVAAIENGMSQTEAENLFNIARKTIYCWLLLKEQTGDLQPQTGYQQGHSHGIKDREGFKKLVDKHADYTQKELGEHFSVGSSTIGRAMKKIAYTRKKRARPIPSEKKKQERHSRKK